VAARKRAEQELDRGDDLASVLELLSDVREGRLVPADADEWLELFSQFCGCLLLEDRTRMELLSHERTILRDYFAGCRETLVLVPKKNGKTTLIAALLLFHLLVTPEALCVIAAASIKQAGTLYRQAVGFIRRSNLPERRKKADPVDGFIVRGGTREIRTTWDDEASQAQILAADADTADGVIPTLAIVDELHRHRSADLYHAFSDGLGPRSGRIVTISTAGDDELSPLGRMRRQAQLRYQEVRDGAYRRLADAEPAASFVLHEWALDLEQDRDDMAVVKTANPAPWHTLALLQERHDSPSTTGWQWARFACGVWYPVSEDPAIRPEEWESIRDKTVQVRGGNASLGVDFGWKNETDTTAIVACRWDGPDRQVLGDPIILVPAGDGSLLDDRAITAALLQLCGKKTFDRDVFETDLCRDNNPEVVSRWADAIELASPLNVAAVVFDPNQGGQQLCQQLEREWRLPFVRFDQRAAALARADGQFTESVRRKSLRHDWSQEATAHVMNAVAVPVAGGAYYFGRPKHGARLPTDALRAASMVHSVMLATSGKPKADPGTRKGYSFS
jgi:phage terminase large subunit-like protein